MNPIHTYTPTASDIEIAEQQRLLSDRNKFYAKLTHIGFIPDEDMRHKVESLKLELERRIEKQADYLIAIGG